ncbi:MAG: TIGR03936 family radical SAM-associated protein [Defluviitaleaceae bacterium]|nr:TIGR03936 family radical SAM-associated protein [Defluviitaleaceae bacterium]
MNQNIRLRFAKGGALRFIGHLDFQRVFMQTVTRAGLPAAYSQGFNPHILLSFALPLPLGMASINDYADIALAAPMAQEEIIQRLNAAAPAGLAIHEASPYEGKGAAAITTAAKYEFTPTTTLPPDACEKIMAMEALVVPKKTKSGVKDTDIRPDIFQLTHGETITMLLAAGSARFINPLTVAGQLAGQPPCPSTICRVQLYKSSGKELVAL